MKSILSILFIVSLLFHQCSFIDRYQYAESSIRVNQVGYLAAAKKMAVIVSPENETFQVRNEKNETVYDGYILKEQYWDQSGEMVAIADFTSFNIPGVYHIMNGGIESPPFRINDSPFTDLIRSSVKSYYFNRATTALDESHAGTYKRPFSHPDSAVVVHASVISDMLSVGSEIATPYGWYDAGDYNKYVVNSGITTYTLLTAYEHNRQLFDSLKWNIPESGNALPDLLDEILWNLKWMETMQDSQDGGVFHKTTTANFEGFVKAAEASGKRYVVAKGTAATLNFCAVLARASRVVARWDTLYASQLLEKSKLAWRWAHEHPGVVFKNPISIDPDYPSITTGEYGDAGFNDEFFWAGVELFLATGEDDYLDGLSIESFGHFSVPSWGSVEALGLISLASSEEVHSHKKEASDELMRMAEHFISDWREAPYRITLNRFNWGSNSTILNQSMILLNAFRVFGNAEYYEAALSGLDYVLGKNATGYCFVTGFGTQSPKHIHHRQSATDGIAEPIPGLLVGGPNPRNVNQDCGESGYPVLLPARCYVDSECSYSTNEVAINWNAPLVYTVSSLQTIYAQELKID